MTLHSTMLRAIGLAVALAVMTVPSADAAQSRKHKKRAVAQSAISAKPAYWGRDLVRAGPLYNGPDYLGDDPDPNIRSQILRDLTGRYGGID